MKDFYDILDYINLVPPVKEEQIMSDNGRGVQVLIRNCPKKPRLQDVSVEDWCIANTRIMDKLFREGKLSATGLRDNMSHTITICEYFRVFVNMSVLQYDREYRLLQAQEGFRWGSDAPHLYNVHLRRKAVPRTESVTRSSGQWTSLLVTCSIVVVAVTLVINVSLPISVVRMDVMGTTLELPMLI